MKIENIPADIKSKSLKEARDEIDEILIKLENEKENSEKVTINPYDQIPLRRRLIDKKNSKVEFFDLGNHVLIIGLILIVIFISLNVD